MMALQHFRPAGVLPRVPLLAIRAGHDDLAALMFVDHGAPVAHDRYLSSSTFRWGWLFHQLDSYDRF
jgi:hypothetical protein